MKNIYLYTTVILAVALIALGCFMFTAPKTSSVNELVSFVDNAAQQVSQQGPTIFPAFRDKTGSWIKGDSYIFVYDMSGNTLVLPPQPELEGTNRMTTADPQGELFVKTMVNILSTKSYGWNSYLYIKPGSTTPSDKLSYFKKVTFGGNSYIVGSGIYLK